MIVETHPDRETWLKARQKSLGGSDVVNLLRCEVDGREPRGPYWLWVQKSPVAWDSLSESARDRYREIDEAWTKNVNVQARSAMEPVIREWAQEESGLCIIDPGDYCILRDGRRHASPDGLALSEPLDCAGRPYSIGVSGEFLRVSHRSSDAEDSVSVVRAREASYKTVSPFARRHWGDEPSEYGIWQAQWTMLVTGWELNYVFAQIGFGDTESDRLSYTVERNEELIAALQAAEEEFWGYVDRDEEPPADGLKYSTDAIRLLHDSRPKGGKKIMLPASFTALEVRRRQLDFEIKTNKREVEKIRQEVELAMIGQGDDVTDATVPVSKDLEDTVLWRRQKVKGKTGPCGYCKGTGERTTKDQTRLQALKG